MTELSSTEAEEAAGGGGFRRPGGPVPPRPPVPVDDGGPATTAMTPVPATDETVDVPVEPAYLDGSSYSRVGGSTMAPEQLTGIGIVSPPAVTTLPGDLNRPPLAPPPPKRGFPKPARKAQVRGPRRAKLVLRRVDPWSVLKFSFLFSICLLIVWVVAVGALFSLLRTMHVFANINSVLASATSDPSSKGIQINPTSHEVTLWAGILGAVNALLFTALATLGAFLYNLISMLVGGVEVTLAERD